MSASVPLRQAAIKGGIFLAGRQVVSIGLKIIGVMVITRLLGPSGYGSYVAAFAVYQYILNVGQAGIGVYLLRHEGDVSEPTYRTAYTLLLILSVALLLTMEVLRQPLIDYMQVEGFGPVAAIIFLALPFQFLGLPAQVMIERELNYRAVALLDILAQVMFYVVSVPLVLLGYGPISLGIGWVAQQVCWCVTAFILARTLPAFGWDGTTGRQIITYSASFSVANWIWQSRMLVNPLIVGPALGAQAVGLVGMAIGLLEMLSIIKTIIWRLSVAVLGRFQNDVERLRQAVTEGMELQALAVGTILLGFGWTGGYIVPIFFGDRWAPVMDVYPYIALSYMTTAVFNMHSAAISVLGRNKEMTIAYIIHVLMFATVAYFAVPKLGMTGYGFGELATLPSYALLHLLLARLIGSPRYGVTALVWCATAIGLFWREIGAWAIAIPFIALVVPPVPSRLMFFYKKLRTRG